MNLVRNQLIYLTGQSDPRRCGLSVLQHDFGTRLAAALGCSLHPQNFPWFAELLDDPAELAMQSARAGIVRASWHNARQFLATQRSGFAARWADAWPRLQAQAGCTFVLAGSCGLALLAALRPSAESLRHIRVFAYGPVTHWLLPVPTLLVQGRRDPWSRFFVPHPDAFVAGSHLDYLADPAVWTLARDWFSAA